MRGLQLQQEQQERNRDGLRSLLMYNSGVIKYCHVSEREEVVAIGPEAVGRKTHAKPEEKLSEEASNWTIVRV